MDVRRSAPLFASLGIAAALFALAIWIVGLPISWLDAATGTFFVAGLTASTLAYLRGSSVAVKRLGVVGIGANGAGLAMLAILYATG
jgi:hypothetical protein